MEELEKQMQVLEDVIQKKVTRAFAKAVKDSNFREKKRGIRSSAAGRFGSQRDSNLQQHSQSATSDILMISNACSEARHNAPPQMSLNSTYSEIA